MGFSQEETPKDSLNKPLIEKLFDTADGLVNLVSGESWTFIPAVTYSPETHLGIGVRALKIFRRQHNNAATRPSSLPITLLYTLKKQIIFTAGLDLWMNENTHHLQGRVELSDYPFVFYGIGNHLPSTNREPYASRYGLIRFSYQKQIVRNLYIGPRYEFRTDYIYKKEAGGMLDSGAVPGSSPFQASGLGLLVNYDSRDNIFQPTEGSLHQAIFMGFLPLLGSQYTFNQYQLDFRRYFEVNNGKILALQAWYSFTSGSPPFQYHAMMGGSDVMRGYFEGRYRDRHAMVYQGEYRIPVHRKLGIVLFGSAGQVGNKISSYAFDRFRYGGGLGFRYRLTEEGVNIRLDFAYGDQAAWYFGLNEIL